MARIIPALTRAFCRFLGPSVYVPVIRTIRSRGVRRSKISGERPMFPGYAFVPLDFRPPAPGFIGLVAFAGVPAKISANDLRAVRATEQEISEVAARRRAHFAIGDPVRIADGAFAGFMGRIEHLDDGGRIRLLFAIFGQSSRVSLSSDWVEKL